MVQKVFRLQTLFACFFLAASFALAQTGAAYTDGAAAGLGAAQIKKLQSLGVAVAVPTFVPDGYKFKKLNVPKTEAPEIVDYSLVYANAAGKTFTIQSTNEGIGDVFVKEEATGKNPFFAAEGNGEFYAGHPDADITENDGSVSAQWIGSSKKYQPKTQKVSQFYMVTSNPKSITPQIAVKIMQSLRYLKL